MKPIGKSKSNALNTNFGRGAKFPRNYDALPHIKNLIIIYRDISRVNRSSVTPPDDTVIIQFICYVQPTRFHDISTTPFDSHGYGHQVLRYALDGVLRAHWDSRGPLTRPMFLLCSSKNTRKKPVVA